jgi:hypothetical protein
MSKAEDKAAIPLPIDLNSFKYSENMLVSERVKLTRDNRLTLKVTKPLRLRFYAEDDLQIKLSENGHLRRTYHDGFMNVNLAQGEYEI